MGTAKIQGELWGNAPQDWATIQEPPSKPLWEAMLDGALVGEGSHILDVGCGAGGASELAASRGAKVSGLDAAKGLIDFARQRLPESDFRVGDMESLPYADEQFDAVFAANSVQFSGNHLATLREFARVCRSQGRIVAGLFGQPEHVKMAAIFKSVAMLLPTPPAGGGPFALSAPGKLAGLFAEAGLNVIATGEVDCPFNYPDFATLWRGIVSSGPLQALLYCGWVRTAFLTSGKKRSSNQSKVYNYPATIVLEQLQRVTYIRLLDALPVIGMVLGMGDHFSWAEIEEWFRRAR